MENLSQPKDTQQNLEVIKVLVADDDPPTRVLLRAAISQWGYQIVEAKDGEEAWEILQAVDSPRLLILDWLMPKLDGVDLCRRIKQDNVYRPYIILLTQVAGTANIIKGLEAGADEFLSKPFNMAELRSRLSVGSRIIRYENELAAQNLKLHNYTSSMEALARDKARQLLHHTDMLVMLGAVVLNISKEIDDAFTTISSASATLPGAEAEKEKISRASQKVRELQTSLNNVIDVIKSLQSDGQAYPNKTVSCQINEIIKLVLGVCESPLRTVKIDTHLGNDLPAIDADPELIQQALVGLLLNISDALKSQTSGTLKVTTALVNNSIQITLEDSGDTLTPEQINTMLEGVNDFTNTYKHEHQKRLNVAMSKDILAKYHGTLSAENSSTGGIKFVLNLPLQNTAKDK